ncbi:MAG TPA: HRDC domain-containing protein [Thermomicrobiales bacterium]|nr:HRDC domain-containing protein [Thermomicrobiales bacterium]
MPFAVGKSGLTKVLAGSITAAVKGDRAPQFGALEAFPQTRIGGLIERLIEDDYIHRDEASEYRLLSLTDAGRAATLGDLAGYDAPTSPSRQPAASARLTTGARLLDGFAPPDGPDEHEWTPDELALLDHLKAWRTEQAHERGVPAYVVAQDRMLQDLVLRRPRTADELLTVKGFGPARVDTYGADLLALIAGRDDGDA